MIQPKRMLRVHVAFNKYTCFVQQHISCKSCLEKCSNPILLAAAFLCRSTCTAPLLVSSSLI